jgi:hypothetical protein
MCDMPSEFLADRITRINVFEAIHLLGIQIYIFNLVFSLSHSGIFNIVVVLMCCFHFNSTNLKTHQHERISCGSLGMARLFGSKTFHMKK